MEKEQISYQDLQKYLLEIGYEDAVFYDKCVIRKGYLGNAILFNNVSVKYPGQQNHIINTYFFKKDSDSRYCKRLMINGLKCTIRPDDNPRTTFNCDEVWKLFLQKNKPDLYKKLKREALIQEQLRNNDKLYDFYKNKEKIQEKLDAEEIVLLKKQNKIERRLNELN